MTALFGSLSAVVPMSVNYSDNNVGNLSNSNVRQLHPINKSALQRPNTHSAVTPQQKVCQVVFVSWCERLGAVLELGFYILSVVTS